MADVKSRAVLCRELVPGGQLKVLLSNELVKLNDECKYKPFLPKTNQSFSSKKEKGRILDGQMCRYEILLLRDTKEAIKSLKTKNKLPSCSPIEAPGFPRVPLDQYTNASNDDSKKRKTDGKSSDGKDEKVQNRPANNGDDLQSSDEESGPEKKGEKEEQDAALVKTDQGQRETVMEEETSKKNDGEEEKPFQEQLPSSAPDDALQTITDAMQSAAGAAGSSNAQPTITGETGGLTINHKGPVTNEDILQAINKEFADLNKMLKDYFEGNAHNKDERRSKQEGMTTEEPLQEGEMFLRNFRIKRQAATDEVYTLKQDGRKQVRKLLTRMLGPKIKECYLSIPANAPSSAFVLPTSATDAMTDFINSVNRKYQEDCVKKNPDDAIKLVVASSSEIRTWCRKVLSEGK